MALVAAAYGKTVPAPPPNSALEDFAFSNFIKDFRSNAIAAGIAGETYDAATAGIQRNQRISELNLNQPEFSKPIWSYLDSAVSPRRIVDGRAVMIANQDILTRVTAKYPVPPEILVSIWGNETDYGREKARYKLIEALATLAYDGPRIDYARPQLIAALKMIEREHYDPAAMKSSWAGAFGQTQFVPTTFLRQAVDGDGDGKIDLWHDVADALASTANVIQQAGWVPGKPWGYEIALPPGFAYEDADIDNARPIATWRRAGVKTVAGNDLPPAGDPASIYLPAGARGPAFLIFPNFKAILKYNNAASYALAVCLLADQIGPKASAGGPVMASWPRDLSPLSREERLTLQDSLTKLGFDIGKIDGMIGAKSRAALRSFQKSHALPADGFATPEILTRIAMEARSKLASP